MAAFDDESGFGAKPKPALAHEIGQTIDDFVGARALGAHRSVALGERPPREGDRGASSNARGRRLGL